MEEILITSSDALIKSARVLSLLCSQIQPVRTFGWIVEGEEASLAAFGGGALFSAGCTGLVLYAAKKNVFTNLIMPGMLGTYGGLSVALLGLANWRVCYDERKGLKKKQAMPGTGTRLTDEDMITALEYLAGHYKQIFEKNQKIEKDPSWKKPPVDIPLEFAFAFSYGLIKFIRNRNLRESGKHKKDNGKFAKDTTDFLPDLLDIVDQQLFDKLKAELEEFEKQTKLVTLGQATQPRTYCLYEMLLNILEDYSYDYHMAKRDLSAFYKVSRIPMKRRMVGTDSSEVADDLLSFYMKNRRIIKPSLPKKFHLRQAPQGSDDSNHSKVDISDMNTDSTKESLKQTLKVGEDTARQNVSSSKAKDASQTSPNEDSEQTPKKTRTEPEDEQEESMKKSEEENIQSVFPRSELIHPCNLLLDPEEESEYTDERTSEDDDENSCGGSWEPSYLSNLNPEVSKDIKKKIKEMFKERI